MTQYSSFQEMAANQREGRDYRIESWVNDPSVLILAIHGGKIEQHTDVIAKAIAKDDFSYYGFLGTKTSNNSILHITSHQYQEDRLLEMLSTAEQVISLHGKRGEEESFVMPGGLDIDLKERITDSLEREGFIIKSTTAGVGAVHPGNVCNRGLRGGGVQLEISKKLRTRLRGDPVLLASFVGAVRKNLLDSSGI